MRRGGLRWPNSIQKLMQVLKDGMQHFGKLICSSMGAQMDSEPKRWRIFGTTCHDCLWFGGFEKWYLVGTTLERDFCVEWNNFVLLWSFQGIQYNYAGEIRIC